MKPLPLRERSGPDGCSEPPAAKVTQQKATNHSPQTREKVLRPLAKREPKPAIVGVICRPQPPILEGWSERAQAARRSPACVKPPPRALLPVELEDPTAPLSPATKSQNPADLESHLRALRQRGKIHKQPPS